MADIQANLQSEKMKYLDIQNIYKLNLYQIYTKYVLSKN